MLKPKDFKPKSEFKYWYVRKGLTNDFAVTLEEKVVAVIKYAERTHEIIAVPAEGSNLEADELTVIEREFFDDYTKRPEFIMCTKIPDELLTDNPIDTARANEMKEYCNMFIQSCCYMMYSDDAIAQKYVDRAIKWLEGTDFYTAPASTRYHDSEPCGLLKHTLKVVNRVIDLTTIDPFKSINLHEAILVAIVHDFCKINFYESFMRNVKNDETGEWEKVASYRHKPSEYPFGHGVSSLYIAEKLFKFSLEQALAIRWHMSIYDVSDYEKSDLFDANEKYPMVMLVQMADQLSIL